MKEDDQIDADDDDELKAGWKEYLSKHFGKQKREAMYKRKLERMIKKFEEENDDDDEEEHDSEK